MPTKTLEPAPPLVSTPAGGYLGPATVLAIDGNRLHLECPDCYVWARLAMPAIYTPVAGDSVLAISQNSQWFVIGVLEAHGPTTITAPGDLRISAPAGRVELSAGEAVSVRSRMVKILAEEWELAAKRAFSRFGSLTQWVTDTLRTHAERVVFRSRQETSLRASRINASAEGDVRVRGKMINLN